MRSFLLAVALTALPVAVGVLVAGGEEEPATEPDAAPRYTSTPLADLDTSAVVVARAPFCDLVPEEAAAQALGGEPRATTAYDNGDSAAVTAGVRDVAHEYGCRFAGARGAEAAAWVFVPPVTDERARDLLAEAEKRKRCSPTTAPAYGDPSVALVCREGKRTAASFHGLFGDSWLSCRLATRARLDESELLDRTGRWCAAVAQAASSTGSAAQQ